MDLIETLLDLSTAKVLIVIGALLIVLYVVGRLGQWISLPDSRRMPALIVGLFLLGAGITLEVVKDEGSSATASASAPTSAPTVAPTVARPASAGPQSGVFYVVMGSFANRSGAERQQSDAQSAGIDATILPGETLGLTAGNFIVASGPFARSRADEKVAAAKAKFASAYLKQTP